MGSCVSVPHSDHQIHNAEFDHSREKSVIFLDHENNHSTDTLGSIYSKEGSKGLNQDSAILYQGFGAKGRALCGVFDGHGENGHFVSETVKNRLPALLLNHTNLIISKKKKIISGEKWKEAIVSAFKVMDKEMKIEANLNLSTSGTTAVIAVRHEEDLILANLGDSRAVLGTLDESIKAVQLTTDLKPALPCEEERIRACKGRVLALESEPHIQRVWLPYEDSPGLAMSRSFGDFLLKDYGIIAVPEVSSHRISSNDQFIVLATDGVWDVMSNDEVAAVVWEAAAEGNEEVAATAVVEAANEAWRRKFPKAKVDDCSVVCLFLHNRNNMINNVSPV